MINLVSLSYVREFIELQLCILKSQTDNSFYLYNMLLHKQFIALLLLLSYYLL